MRIKDVAQKAGVGVGTVSRVMNGSGYVAEETKIKVQNAIEELNYAPNELARNLLHKRTNTVAVIVPDISNPFYASLVNEIEKSLRKEGYKTLLCNTVGEQSNEQIYLDMLQRKMVDGILTATHSLDATQYEHLDGPIVSFDTPHLSDRIPVVSADHKRGGGMAAEELIRSGCHHVLQFRDGVEKKYPYFERHEEFERIMKEAGIPCEDCTTEWNRFDVESAEALVKKCIEKYPDVDGVFGTDTLVLYYMKLVRKIGKKIPDDIRFVAYDGTYILETAYPEVTCVAQPIWQLAEKGVYRLLRMIEGEKTEGDIHCPIALIRGETTTP